MRPEPHQPAEVVSRRHGGERYRPPSRLGSVEAGVRVDSRSEANVSTVEGADDDEADSDVPDRGVLCTGDCGARRAGCAQKTKANETVQYWNYDYRGVLNCCSTITCSWITGRRSRPDSCSVSRRATPA